MGWRGKAHKGIVGRANNYQHSQICPCPTIFLKEYTKYVQGNLSSGHVQKRAVKSHFHFNENQLTSRQCHRKGCPDKL